MTSAQVELWGKPIGAVTWMAERGLGVFQFTPEFAAGGIEVAPLRMPGREAPYEFPSLSKETFSGLPGLLADSLPDRFGNALIDVWLANQGRAAASFNPVERLCYTGTRGMGALEYQPVLNGSPDKAQKIEVARLAELANRILTERQQLAGHWNNDADERDMARLFRVGTSAGGARAKAVLAWNAQTGEFRSGQTRAGKGFTHWLLKFDGVDANRDRELADPAGFGRIEYAYHLMAVKAGIVMMPCRLHQQDGRAHFMTRRFDRTAAGGKLHYQSLGALQHFDFNQPGAYSYEQAMQTIQALQLPAEDREQQLRRALFNIIACNRDDHVKNIGFVMDREGEWRLAPAFDVVYSYNPQGIWTSRHQMSLNGKRDGFDLSDLLAFGQTAGLKPRKTRAILSEIIEAVQRWPEFAEQAQVHDQQIAAIRHTLRSDPALL